MGSRLSEFGSGTMVKRPGSGLLIAILLAALPVIAAAAIMITKDGGGEAASVAPATTDLARFTTAPGWEQARVYESGAAKAAALDTHTQKYLTEPYWLQGRSHESGADLSRFTTAPGWEQARANDTARIELETTESLAVPSWGPEQEYALLLREKAYLRSSAAPRVDPAGLNVSGADHAAEIDAYYTERYWKMAAAGTQHAQSDVRERYNTERHQKQIHGR